MEPCRNSSRFYRGFSLIEVMIAVVVLATGLLSLAALQSALARNAADARARSHVAAFVDSVVERQRALDRNLSDFNLLPMTDLWTAGDISEVEADAGVSNLALSITSNWYDGRTGTFVLAASGAVLDKDDPQYKELRITATWTDALGQQRRYELTTILSPRSVNTPSVAFESPTGTSSSSRPMVRTTSPVEAGVIPIAIGDGTDTAATNPRPTINSGNVIRTSYEVLTYHNEAGGSVTQQRRVETAVVGCSCKRGIAPTGVLDGTAQWPAYWNGERYVVYQPEDGDAAPGVSVGAGPANADGDDQLCTQCCRDHHDEAGDEDVKFDPYRTDSADHYRSSGGALVLAGVQDVYMESCRMIRVDGFWRTAQDLDLKHFGLLETANSAKSPIPQSNVDPPGATERYEKFVIDFLKANYVPGKTPIAAEAAYEANNLKWTPLASPHAIPIKRPPPADERYLHARGLYVDHVEKDAQAKIDQANASCSRVNPEECILPFLAFTSINVTEAAFWAAPDGNVKVDTDGFVVFNPDAPNRGRVNALGNASSGQASVTAQIHPSNSGVAVRAQGIDPGDDVNVKDSQLFDISDGGGAGTAGSFNVTLAGLPTAQKTPGVSWMIGDNQGNCQGSAPYSCSTTVALGGPVTLTVGSYNQEAEQKAAVTITCPNSATSPTTPTTLTYTPKGNDRSRVCKNFQVSSAVIGTVSATTPFDVLRDGRVGNLQTGSGSETTTMSFGTVANGNSLVLTFAEQGTTTAPVLTCIYDKKANLSGVTFDHCN